MADREAHLRNFCPRLPSTDIKEGNQGNANLQLIPSTGMQSLVITFILTHIFKKWNPRNTKCRVTMWCRTSTPGNTKLGREGLWTDERRDWWWNSHMMEFYSVIKRTGELTHVLRDEPSTREGSDRSQTQRSTWTTVLFTWHVQNRPPGLGKQWGMTGHGDGASFWAMKVL